MDRRASRSGFVVGRPRATGQHVAAPLHEGVFRRGRDVPGRYVERVRIEAARRRLEDTRDSVEATARACGYGTPEAMRRAFVRALSVSPAEYRRRFQPMHPQRVGTTSAIRVDRWVRLLSATIAYRVPRAHRFSDNTIRCAWTGPSYASAARELAGPPTSEGIKAWRTPLCCPGDGAE
ncbi:helix-turn-helix domain-containing protein [Nocardia altamirensis]|uniref:helix-turn-helix domain-containing protein n=1 Tax=Nocardia altamirensis TaxID=472158 RepID=UPI003F76FBDD